MSEDEGAPENKSRRAGHRQKEILLHANKSTIYLAAGIGILIVLASYYYGFRRGRDSLLEDEYSGLPAVTMKHTPEVKKTEPEENEGLVIHVPDEAPVVHNSSSAPAASKPKAVPQVKEPVRLKISYKVPSGRFGVQLGAFKTPQEAKNFLKKYKNALKALPVFLVSVNLKARGQWTRVRVGAYKTHKAATKLKSDLAKLLPQGSIVVKYR